MLGQAPWSREVVGLADIADRATALQANARCQGLKALTLTAIHALAVMGRGLAIGRALAAIDAVAMDSVGRADRGALASGWRGGGIGQARQGKYGNG